MRYAVNVIDDSIYQFDDAATRAAFVAERPDARVTVRKHIRRKPLSRLFHVARAANGRWHMHRHDDALLRAFVKSGEAAL